MNYKFLVSTFVVGAILLSGCDGNGSEPVGSVRVIQLCEEDRTANVSVNAHNECDKSHDNKTAEPFVVEIPTAPSE